jgi:O-antigen ligase
MAWERAVITGNNNFPIGTGLGGFNTEETAGRELQFLKYPHNIILEIYAELGILPLLGFLLLLVLIFRKSLKIGFELTVMLLYFFWLSLFSKDIATNTQLWFALIPLVLSSESLERVGGSFKRLINGA